MNSNLPIDGKQLWSDLMALAEITDPKIPYTRRSFSPLFLEGRAWLKRRFDEAGLDVRVDAAGNLIGRLEGSSPGVGTIMLGSHSDTVPAGGRFDGVAGVIAALEVLRSLKANGKKTRHAIEVVDFLAEEPSEYGLSCVGSRGMAGLLEPKMLDYRNAGDERLGDAIEKVGGSIASLKHARRDDIVAFLELHIEQGVVLEKRSIDLGIVTAIVGIARVEISFEGRADHAGTTPMDLRQDVSIAMASTINSVFEQAKACAKLGRGHFVATAGVIEVTPNAANVVPGRGRLLIDIRSEDYALAQSFIERLDTISASSAEATNVKRNGWSVLSNTTPATCDRELQGLLRKSSAELGFTTLDMASGAGHDAAFLARITRSAMIFVPCREGRSHAPEEWAESDAVAAGTAALYETLLKIDAEAV